MENFSIDKGFVNKLDNQFEDEFQKSKINDLTDKIINMFEKNNVVQATLCYLLNELKTEYGVLRQVNGTLRDFYKYCELVFGFAKRTINNYIAVFKKFVCADVGPNYRFSSAFRDFNISKLIELLTVSDGQLLNDLKKGKISHLMTVKEIREYVKQLKNGSGGAEKVLEDQNAEIKEEEIPMAYNPAQEYDFAYFEKLSKSQLLNVVWELQKYAHSQQKQKKLKVV